MTVGEFCRAQRSALISTSTAYRTVSHAALCVLTGTMPIHIRVRWRGRIYEVRKKLARPDLGGPDVLLNELHLYEEEAVEEWRREWTKSNANNWTRRLIEDAATFRKRKRNIDHYTMQLLTGHGIFNTYRGRRSIQLRTVYTPYWCNNTVGDAPLRVTLFNGRHAVSEALVSKEGLVGIKVEDTMCISGYCSPNASKQEFDGYIGELEVVIRDSRRRAPKLLVAGDFNAKSMIWGGRWTEPRGTYLQDMLTRNELMPIRTTGLYFFVRNRCTGFPDILNVNRRMS
ncbi:uncharacterized protein LOC117237241 [Bombus vosnesenskii]|uniref:Uncharacterized protein LOC117237241 n=1 Tax=Bombus vosnesenskii TaxID=207650 RepID=A0A6J3KXL3_9HYME|nr:uncharacterized protein LOC117237241 [Bombus vosnesenskii]